MPPSRTRSTTESDRRLAEAEALGDPTRLKLFEAIEAAPAGDLGVAELTRIAGVHHTVVRQHLVRLRDAGLVLESTAEPSGRGRPRLLYRVAPERRRREGEAEHFRRLAALLAEAVTLGLPAREVGRRAGVDAAIGSARRGDRSSPDALAVLLEESERMGFEPTLDVLDDTRADVVLGHCPFGDVAADQPETVCALHQGIAEGIAQATDELDCLGMTVVDPLRAGCRLHVATPVGLPGRRS